MAQTVERTFQPCRLDGLGVLVGIRVASPQPSLDGSVGVEGQTADELPFCYFCGIEEDGFSLHILLFNCSCTQLQATCCSHVLFFFFVSVQLLDCWAVVDRDGLGRRKWWARTKIWLRTRINVYWSLRETSSLLLQQPGRSLKTPVEHKNYFHISIAPLSRCRLFLLFFFLLLLFCSFAPDMDFYSR